MSSKVIYIDTDQPKLVAALINFHSGSISADFSPALSFPDIEMGELILPFSSQANWYCWYTYVDTRAGIDNVEYRTVLFALSKVKHLTRQLLEANSNSDQVWCVGSTDPAIEKVIDNPLEPIDLEVEDQLRERLRITAKVIEEVNLLYAQNIALMTGWKGFLLRLFGVRLPCKKSAELSALTERNLSIVN